MPDARTKDPKVARAAKIALPPDSGGPLPGGRGEGELSSTTLRLVGGLLALLRLGPLLILVVLIIIMANLSPVFATTQNLGNVLVQSAAIAILAIGQLLVILTRGIDLSVGSTLALSAVVGRSGLRSRPAAGSLTILAMLLTGALVGAVNGFGYVFGKLPHPFIVTLATLSIARGLALGLSGGRPISGMPDIVTDDRRRLRDLARSLVPQRRLPRRRRGDRRRPAPHPRWCGVAGSTPSAATRKALAAWASRETGCWSPSTSSAGSSPASPPS